MIYIHPSAIVSDKAEIGDNTKIWSNVYIRENVTIGTNCIIGCGVYIDAGVIIGNNVKIQNYVSIYSRCTIKDGVFLGPYVCITNDKHPRAINNDGSLKIENDWEKGETVIKEGASLGAGTIVLPNCHISSYVMVGAGSVVTKDVKEHTLLYGNPARVKGYVCVCGKLISKTITDKKLCKECQNQ